MKEDKNKVSIVIADDEPHLLDYLSTQIQTLWPDAVIVAKASNGDVARDAIARYTPDIAFLDIRMPGISGLELAEQTLKQCRVVFVTAYEQHAVAAFQAAAVDYLLKPVSNERLDITIQRLKESLIQQQQQTDYSAVLQALQQIHGKQYLKWFRAGQGEKITLVPVDSLVYAQANNKYTSLFTSTKEHVIRIAIKELQEQLDPEYFWQVHRGTIVNVKDILRVEKSLRGRYKLYLQSRDEIITVSRNFGFLFHPN